MLEKDHGEILSWKRRVQERQNVDAHCGYEFVKPTGTALRALSRAAERADWPAYDTAALLRRQHTSNSCTSNSSHFGYEHLKNTGNSQVLTPGSWKRLRPR